MYKTCNERVIYHFDGENECMMFSPYRSVPSLSLPNMPIFRSATLLSGGATIIGNKHVSHVRSTTTNDTFKKIDSFMVILQLACNQTEKQKLVSNNKKEIERIISIKYKISELKDESTQLLKSIDQKLVEDVIKIMAKPVVKQQDLCLMLL